MSMMRVLEVTSIVHDGQRSVMQRRPCVYAQLYLTMYAVQR
jgi:hypothetical protein